jgi:peroxiredoxin
LGLVEEQDTFLIQQVKADVVIIDCFDLYCPSCQKGAKYVNQLYQLIEERGLSGQVKVIGLGLGNTPMEVATFRDKYAVRFPVFPDRSNAVARQFGNVRVPGLVVIRPGTELRVLHREAGVVRDPEKLLKHVLEDLERGTTVPRTSVPGTMPEECEGEVCPVAV